MSNADDLYAKVKQIITLEEKLKIAKDALDTIFNYANDIEPDALQMGFRGFAKKALEEMYRIDGIK